MSEILFEIAFVLALVVANGAFALSEMSIVSSRRARLQQRADGGDAGARVALELSEEPNQLLSTVQIGITLIGILAGAVGGAGLAELLARQFAQVPALEPYSQTLGLGVVVTAIGYLSLVFGELAPKRLALNDPERIASLVARPMRALSKFASPAVRLLSLSTETVVRLLGVRESKEPPVTEQEIRILIRQGTEAGVFDASEQEMVENVFHLGDRKITSLMTPRPDIVWLDTEEPPDRLREKLSAHRFSRFPVCRGEFDHLLGTVRAKDILVQVLEGLPVELASLVRQAVFVPESASALKALEQMKAARSHVALVVDEYGLVQGMVTYHDVLEGIVGDLPGADGAGDEWAVRREDGSWLLDGMLPIEDLLEVLDLGRRGDEVRGAYQTLAGFLIARLGRMPRTADVYEWDGFRFEILDLDGRRVDKVLVSRPGQRGADAGA